MVAFRLMNVALFPVEFKVRFRNRRWTFCLDKLSTSSSTWSNKARCSSIGPSRRLSICTVALKETRSWPNRRAGNNQLTVIHTDHTALQLEKINDMEELPCKLVNWISCDRANAPRTRTKRQPKPAYRPSLSPRQKLKIVSLWKVTAAGRRSLVPRLSVLLDVCVAALDIN